MAKNILRTQRHEANRFPDQHVFVNQVGYVKVPPLQDDKYGTTQRGLCFPPANTSEGSWHRISIPNGATYITFQWMSNCWVRLQNGGLRYGFPPEYLSSHGWAYLGAGTSRHG